MFRRNELRGIAAAAALLFALPACGGDDDGTGPDAGDDGTGGDDGTDDGTGADAGAACPFEDALGTVSLASSKAEHRTQPPPEGQPPDPSFRALLLAGAIDATDTPTNFLGIELWDDYGPFVDSQLAAGEFDIQGDDASPQNCGVCLNLIANFGEENERRYFASAGNVVVNSTGTREGNEITGTFTGTMSDVTLTELDQNGAPLEGGCSTTIEQATWDTPIENGD